MLKKSILVVCLAVSAACLVARAEEANVPVSSGSSVSRAEVLAELALWQRSGMAELSASEGYDPLSPETMRRLAVYTRMRDGAEYHAELQRQRERRGGVVRMIGQAPSSD